MKEQSNSLVRIGELAESAGVPRSTINYYCRLGLIKPAARTVGGYRLFKEKASCSKIKTIKDITENKVTLEDLKGAI